MATITEDFVSFETAKLLKQKGFEGKCSMYYDVEDDTSEPMEVDGHELAYDYYGNYIEAPSQAVVMKWLREVHHIFIQIELYSKYDNYNFEIFQNTYRLWIEERTVYSTYTETVEMAIKYCLEHLIK